MTTLILDWSDWDGPASGSVALTRRSWRRDPDTFQAPWQMDVRVEGRATVDVEDMGGEVLQVRWSPTGASSRTEYVLVPESGAHLVHLLQRVDPATLAPDATPDMPAWEARLAGLVTTSELDARLADLPVSAPSHIALDADGVPAYVLGASDASLITDTDGVPAIMARA